MVLEVPPSRVPLAGPSKHATIAAASLVVFAIVGLAIFARLAPIPASQGPSAAAIVTASESARRTRTASTPSPTPSCVAPRVAPLERPIARHPRPLEPTGFEVLSPWTGAEDDLVADQSSGFWAFGGGHLTRLDGRGRMMDSWTFADDPAFGASGIVAAHAGGVWLFGGTAIAWFDGKRLRDTMNVPGDAGEVIDVAEAADASLWALTRRYAPSAVRAAGPASKVLRWDGSSWSDICGRPTRADLSHIAIDPDGGVWVAPANAGWDVAYFDGSTWSTPAMDAGFDRAMNWSDGWASELVAADDGNVWLAFGGIGLYSGSSWSGLDPEGVDLSGTVSLSVAPDGAVWAATGTTTLPGGEGEPRYGTGIVSFDGDTWTTYDSADGLPSPDPSAWATITAVAASRDGVVAATRDGFHHMLDGHWVRTGSRPTIRAELWPRAILAVSGTEAWILDWESEIWSIQDGTWTEVEVADWLPPTGVHGFDRAPDGTVAVAADHGAAVLRDGRWSVLEEGLARDVTFAPDGALWVATRTFEPDETVVIEFRFDGGDWVRTVLPTLSTPGWPMIEVGRDGRPWVGSLVWGSGPLNRFDGGRWVDMSVLVEGDPVSVASIEMAPNGDLWAAIAPADPLRSPATELGSAIARYDGTTWSVHHLSEISGEPRDLVWPDGLAIAPDGSVWLATDRGIARFDGQRWSARFAGHIFSALSFDTSGALWTVGPSGVQRLPAAGGS